MIDKVKYWLELADIFEDPVLKIHSLSRLAEKTGLDKEMSDEQLEFIDILEPLNIEARYPSHKERLLKSLDSERSKNIIDDTNNLRLWIKSKLLNSQNDTNA